MICKFQFWTVLWTHSARNQKVKRGVPTLPEEADCDQQGGGIYNRGQGGACMEPAGPFEILACVNPPWHLLRGAPDNLLNSSTWYANSVCVHRCACVCCLQTLPGGSKQYFSQGGLVLCILFPEFPYRAILCVHLPRPWHRTENNFSMKSLGLFLTAGAPGRRQAIL